MSTKIEISTFYRTAIANLPSDSEGDFLDALSNDRNANSYYFALCEDEQKVIAFHNETGNVVIDTGSIEEAVEQFVKFSFDKGYPEPILKPLLLGAIHNETDYLAAAFDHDTFEFDSVRELDDVSDYKCEIEGLDTICGFGAVSYNVGAFFDSETRSITLGDDRFENLSDLVGYFDEDGAWVVVLRPYQRSPSNKATSQGTASSDKKEVKCVCSRCGQTIEEGAKYCVNCGEPVCKSAKLENTPLPELDKNEWFNDLLSIKKVSIEAVGPDSDANYSITVNYSIKNSASEAFGPIGTHVSLFNSTGVFLESRNSSEDSIQPNETAEYEAYFWGFSSKALGDDLEKLSVLIELTGYRGVDKELGEYDVPSQDFDISQIAPVIIDEKLRLISGSIWKTKLDNEKYADVYVKCALHNLSDDLIAEAKLIALVKSKSDEDLIDATAQDQIKPASTATLTSIGYCDGKALAQAKIKLSLRCASLSTKASCTHTGAVVATENLNEESSSAFVSLAATLGRRQQHSGNQDDEQSIRTDPIPCYGSFEINVVGRGGETVVGSISKRQFDYWTEHSDKLAEHIAGESDVPGEVSLMEWSDQDDIAHCSGAEFTEESTRITVNDANGNEIWSVDADQDTLIDHGIDVEVNDEMAIYQLDHGYYFCGRAFEKGSFFTATVEAEEFDPTKLKFLLNSINEWLLLGAIYYDSEELVGTDGYSTRTTGSEYFVEESES